MGCSIFFLIWVIVVQRLRSIAWGHPETPSSLVTGDHTMPGPLPSASGACGHTLFSGEKKGIVLFKFSLLFTLKIVYNYEKFSDSDH